jgi:hypothetical protein
VFIDLNIEVKGAKMPTQIMACDCNHPYHDKVYGQGRRVHNRTLNGNWRCVICGKEKKGQINLSKEMAKGNKNNE